MSTLAANLFDRWAPSYDAQPNAMLQLEERTAPHLFPELKGKHILDIGCGTGRWLQRLEATHPASLTGVDASAAMLQQAATKLAHTTTLHQGDCVTLPFNDATFDLILCSFTLSYIEDLSAFAHTCARVMKPGGHLILSDMHPVTAEKHQWRRTFQDHGTTVQLTTHAHSLEAIAKTFADAGIAILHQEEPSFGPPERPLFEQTSRLNTYEDLANTPAIYLMKLRKPNTLHLTNTRWATDATTWSNEALLIEDSCITDAEQTITPHTSQLDLSGYILLPGLINAHDHLEFALFPNLGRAAHEAPYRNATEWAHEIHTRHAHTITQHRSIPLNTRLWWGAIRNLLAGVTTVCHHNPLHPELADPTFPIRIVQHLGWAHSVAFEPHLEQRLTDTPGDQPFILHAAEGTDTQSRNELNELHRRALLTGRTALVHALALEADDVLLLNRTGTSVILCPTSNRFLFHRVMPTTIIGALDCIAIGSDSPLTAAGDLLDELRLLHTEQSIPAIDLYDSITTSAAAILHLRQGEGSIAPGAPADLVALRDRGLTPAETLVTATLADIELVLIAGNVQLASPALYTRLKPHQREGLHALEIAGQTRYLRAPLPKLFAAAEQHLGRNQLRLGNKEVRRAPAL